MINVRVAESIYWTGRYTERIINHTNLIDVSFHSYLSWTENTDVQNELWQRLLNVLGEADAYWDRYSSLKTRNVLNFLTLDKTYGNSIIACAGSARENVRAIRQELPTPLWETINGFHLWLTAESQAKRIFAVDFKPYDFYKGIKQAVTLFHGIAETTMIRDEEWRLLQLGRYIERAENISRLVLMMHRNTLEMRQNISNNRYHQLTAALRAVDGLESYRKINADRVSLGAAAAFLVGQPLFPRSIHYSLTIFKRNLLALAAPTENMQYSPLADVDALLDQINSYGEDDYTLESLPDMVWNFLAALNVIGTKVYKTYFHEVDTIL